MSPRSSSMRATSLTLSNPFCTIPAWIRHCLNSNLLRARPGMVPRPPSTKCESSSRLASRSSREPPPYGERDRDSEARRGVGHTPDAAAFRRGDRSGPGGQTANDWLPYQGEFDPNSEAGGGVFGPEFAVVEADGAGGDGQAEADAAGGAGARIVDRKST